MSTSAELAEQNSIALTFGNKLKATREALGLTQKDAGAQLRLNEKIIPMLESGQYDPTLPVTFLRGYLRSYSKFLNLRDDEIRTALEPIQYQPFMIETDGCNKPANGVIKNKFIMRVATYLVGISITGLVGAWWLNHSPSLSILNQQVALNLPNETVSNTVENDKSNMASAEANPPPMSTTVSPLVMADASHADNTNATASLNAALTNTINNTAPATTHNEASPTATNGTHTGSITTTDAVKTDVTSNPTPTTKQKQSSTRSHANDKAVYESDDDED